ncbi:MAG: hypothetical protein HYU66_07240 [Armatimonadetes bacterium]|nr:hypothetical protein [Armatimonadota bacterium]
MSSWTCTWRWGRRGGLLLGLLALGLDLGCGANGFGTNSLVGPVTRSSTTLDGFVFVPSRSRQTVVGSTIPHALLRVYRLPRTAGDVPVALGQAGADGSYQIAGLPIGVSLQVIAEEPFPPVGQAPHQLQGVVSFQGEGDTRNRNLNENSTLAAATFVRSGSTLPISEAQNSQLEAAAEDFIARNDPESITTDPELLDDLAELLQTTSFGGLRLRLFSTPPVTASVQANGVSAGSVLTTLPDGAGGELLLDNLAVGGVALNITAPGFVTDSFVAEVEGGETNDVDRILVPVGQPAENQLPSIDTVAASPDPLPFTGGEVTIRATIHDPEDDEIEAAAQVVVAGAAARTSPGELIGETDLAREGSTDIYSGTVEVPGNAGTANAVYTVTVSARDGDNRPTVQKVGSFAVAGVAPPPPPPSEPSAAERAAFVARLTSTWGQVCDGDEPLDPDLTGVEFGPPPAPRTARQAAAPDGSFRAFDDGLEDTGYYSIVSIHGDVAYLVVTVTSSGGMRYTRTEDPRVGLATGLSNADRTLWIRPGADAPGQLGSLYRRGGTGDNSPSAIAQFAFRMEETWVATASGPVGSTQPQTDGLTLEFSTSGVGRPYIGGASGMWSLSLGQSTATGPAFILSVDGDTAQVLLSVDFNSGIQLVGPPGSTLLVEAVLNPSDSVLRLITLKPGGVFYETDFQID